jgi:hypothetical protein
MVTIRVSELVWDEIAKLGRFGESEDDVLRRVFKLQPGKSEPVSVKRRAGAGAPGALRRPALATDRLSSYISGNQLRVEFATGPSHSWSLPAKSDKEAIRRVRSSAVDFVERHGASIGQSNAVRKTLTEAGYHLIK